MVDIDLDILVAKPTTLKLLGKDRVLRDMTMDESFQFDFLRLEIQNLISEGRETVESKKFKDTRAKLIKLAIEPITDNEILQIKQKQFTALMEEIDYQDSLDQGIVENREEYEKLKEQAKEDRKKAMTEATEESDKSFQE